MIFPHSRLYRSRSQVQYRPIYRLSTHDLCFYPRYLHRLASTSAPIPCHLRIRRYVVSAPIRNPHLTFHQESRYTISYRCVSSSQAFSKFQAPPCRQTDICASLRCRWHSCSGARLLHRSQSGQMLPVASNPGPASRAFTQVGATWMPTSGY